MEIDEEDLQHLAKQVGTRIQQLRKIAGFTQEQLEQKTNVYDVGLLERGETNPTLLTLLRLASALDVDLMEFFRFSEERAQIEQVRTEIIDLLSGKSVDDHQRALGILKLVFS